MGKTKTAFLTDEVKEEKSGKEAYEERQKKKAAKMAAAMGEKAQVKGVGLKGGERIKFVGSDIPETTSSEPATEAESEATDTTVSRTKQAKVRGKKYRGSTAMFDRQKHYPTKEAVKFVKETSYSKFDGSVEIHVVTKSAINRQLDLPHSTGKTKRVVVANDDVVEMLKKGKVEFDLLLATADMMPKLVPFARLLGPKGLMPNPKNGTIIKSAKDAEKFSGSSVTLKTQKDFNIVHLVVGKVSQAESELSKNVDAVLDAIDRKKVERAFLSPTMGPSVKLQI